jgi:ATP-dependent Zn protease
VRRITWPDQRLRTLGRVVMAILLLLIPVWSSALAQAETPERSSKYLTILLSWLPMILLVGVWLFFMRSFRGNQSKTWGHLSRTDESMSEIAKQLERIANSLEKRER